MTEGTCLPQPHHEEFSVEVDGLESRTIEGWKENVMRKRSWNGNGSDEEEVVETHGNGGRFLGCTWLMYSIGGLGEFT